MKIYEILLEEDSGVSSGDSGSADSGTTTNGGSNSAEATPSTDTSTTTSGNVATVIYPLGSMIARPYFNYVRPSKKCKYGKKKDGKCKKKPA
jgi:hypothetical protein